MSSLVIFATQYYSVTFCDRIKNIRNNGKMSSLVMFATQYYFVTFCDRIKNIRNNGKMSSLVIFATQYYIVTFCDRIKSISTADQSWLVLYLQHSDTVLSSVTENIIIDQSSYIHNIVLDCCLLWQNQEHLSDVIDIRDCRSLYSLINQLQFYNE